MSTSTIEQLRRQLREKFPQACGDWRGPQPRPDQTAPSATEARKPRSTPEHPSAPADRAGGADLENPGVVREDEWLYPASTDRQLPEMPGDAWSPAAAPRPPHAPPGLAIPPGTLAEIVTPGPTAGPMLALATLLAEVPDAAPSPAIALIDAADGFDPASFSATDCARLLWVRCQNALDALKSADWLARDGNLPTIVLDATGISPEALRKLPPSAWWRLRQATELHPCRLVVLSRHRLVPAAHTRWHLSASLTLTDFDARREDLCLRFQERPVRQRQFTSG